MGGAICVRLREESVDERRVLSGIVFVNRNGLRWFDASKDYGPHKTLDNRWKRWSDNRRAGGVAGGAVHRRGP
jgi:transposase